jgi:thiol-disulfide isomerase/thioredoxin
MFSFVLLTTSLFFTSCDKIEFTNDLHQAFNDSKISGKNVLVILGKSNCGKCDKLIDDLNSPFSFNRSTIIDDYISVKLDYNSKQGNDFAMLSNATFTPYVAVFNSDVEMQALFLANDTYDFKDLSNNEVDDYVFKEMFDYNTNLDTYKKQLSLSFQSWLLSKKKILKINQQKET